MLQFNTPNGWYTIRREEVVDAAMHLFDRLLITNTQVHNSIDCGRIEEVLRCLRGEPCNESDVVAQVSSMCGLIYDVPEPHRPEDLTLYFSDGIWRMASSILKERYHWFDGVGDVAHIPFAWRNFIGIIDNMPCSYEVMKKMNPKHNVEYLRVEGATPAELQEIADRFTSEERERIIQYGLSCGVKLPSTEGVLILGYFARTMQSNLLFKEKYPSYAWCAEYANAPTDRVAEAIEVLFTWSFEVDKNIPMMTYREVQGAIEGLLSHHSRHTAAEYADRMKLLREGKYEGLLPYGVRVLDQGRLGRFINTPNGSYSLRAVDAADKERRNALQDFSLANCDRTNHELVEEFIEWFHGRPYYLKCGFGKVRPRTEGTGHPTSDMLPCDAVITSTVDGDVVHYPLHLLRKHFHFFDDFIGENPGAPLSLPFPSHTIHEVLYYTGSLTAVYQCLCYLNPKSNIRYSYYFLDGASLGLLQEVAQRFTAEERDNVIRYGTRCGLRVPSHEGASILGYLYTVRMSVHAMKTLFPEYPAYVWTVVFKGITDSKQALEALLTWSFEADKNKPMLHYTNTCSRIWWIVDRQRGSDAAGQVKRGIYDGLLPYGISASLVYKKK